MAKLGISTALFETTNVQNLPNYSEDDATNVKITFDKASADIKDYLNNTLNGQLNDGDGSKRIGHDSFNITSDNVGDSLEELKQELQGIVVGEIPTNTITNALLVGDIKVGSLSSLSTIARANVVEAINEVDANEGINKADISGIKADININETATVSITAGSWTNSGGLVYKEFNIAGNTIGVNDRWAVVPTVTSSTIADYVSTMQVQFIARISLDTIRVYATSDPGGTVSCNINITRNKGGI